MVIDLVNSDQIYIRIEGDYHITKSVYFLSYLKKHIFLFTDEFKQKCPKQIGKCSKLSKKLSG